MAKKTAKKPVKTKSSKPAGKIAKSPPAKKAKPVATGTKAAAGKKAANVKSLSNKAASGAKKQTAPQAKKNTSSVKSTPKPVSKKTAPKAAGKSAAVSPAVKSGASPVKGGAAPASAAAKVEAKKSEAKPAKAAKTPFMPVVVTTKPVPLPAIKKPLLEIANEIVIKQAYNPKKMPPFYKKQQQRLIELRSALYDTMDGMAKETLRSRPEGSDASVGGMHMGDAGSDAYDRDFALSMLSKEQDALYEITEALGRLERGVYGICELSGKKINDERLEALPYTRYTREMQEQIERDNMGGRFRRPVVRSVFGLDDAAEDEDDEEAETPKESPPQESSLDFMKE